MPNIDLPTAKRLAEGVRCPTCEGAYAHLDQGEDACPTCDGKGLYWKGEWPQFVHAKLTSGAADNWVFGLCLGPVNGALYVIYQRHDGSYRADWNHHFTDYYPAPHPVDVLLWLEEQGVIELVKGEQWYAMTLHDCKPHLADTPDALLTAVLDSLAC